MKNSYTSKRVLKICFFSLMTASFNVYAQVSINISNPQALFYVNGAKDNAITGLPSIMQQLNNIVINSNGNMGIGTNSPTNKLHINGSLRLVDGTQDNGKILVSDADVIATWQNSSPPVVISSSSGVMISLGVGS